MHRLKRVVATVLLFLVMGLGTPQIFAQGTVKPTETPGVATQIQPSGDTTSEASDIIDSVVIYLLSTLIP